MKKLLLLLLTGALLFSGCGETPITETDTAETQTIPETTETEAVADEPVLTPAKHEITVEDASGILAANELSVKDGRYYPYQNFHGGQQMRSVHTERGTYAAFLKHFNVSEYNPSYTGYSELYLAKVDNNGGNTILLYDEYDSYGKDVELNIALDTNGNVAHAGIDTHMDNDGNIHITYGSSLIGGDPYVTLDSQKRHAVYNGMECVFNEEFSMPVAGKTHIRQDSNGNLYMIESQSGAWDDNIMYIRIYKADDALGRTWTLVKENTIEGMKTVSFSINSHRSCPTQDDNILSCFIFGSTPKSFTRYTLFDSTAYVFNLSLEDYSITEPVDMLAGYDLTLDTIITYPAHGASHQNKVVHTENGTYAVLSTEYKKDHEYLSYNWADYETFQIIKIENDNTAKILYTDTYSCSTDKVAQSMYMNIKQMPDGLIYVSPPSGFFLYVIDPATDEVTVHQPTEVWNYTKQSDFFVDADGQTHMVLATTPSFMRQSAVLDTEEWKYGKLSRAYNAIGFDAETTVPAAGSYSNFYTIEDGNGGVYYVGTRYITPEDLEDAGLTYSGYTNKIDDSIALFHIPDLTEMKNNTFTEICLPYVEQGDEGTWSVVNVESAGDVYLDSEGQLHIFYTYYLFDFDDTDRRGNPELIDNTFKKYHAIYKDGEVIST
ncbi:MAG: hypothetical protein IJ325_09925 [Clostridia bacterium]|nr:hypothetical protein [Clostridia bacterium]